MYELIKNARPPFYDGKWIEGYYDKRGLRLARQISKNNIHGLELIVIDKGQGFQIKGKIIILAALEVGFSTTDGGNGLPICKYLADELEIESVGYIWNSNRRFTLPFIRPNLIKVPEIQGAMVRAEIYDGNHISYDLLNKLPLF